VRTRLEEKVAKANEIGDTPSIRLVAKDFCRPPLSFGCKCADKEYETLLSHPEDPSMISSVLGPVSGSTITAPNIDDVTNTPAASSAQTGPAADNDRIVPRGEGASPDLATVAMLLPPLGDFGPVADQSPRAKLQSAAESGLAEASHDTSTSAGKYLSDPKHQALVAGSITAFAAVQALPGPDGAIDATVGAVGAAMYASAGPEHKVNIEKALAELKQYGAGATGAKSQGDLDAAAHHFARFLEIGGPEAADAVGALAVSPVKLGGIAGKAITLSSDALSAGAKGTHERRHGSPARRRCSEPLARRGGERSCFVRKTDSRTCGRGLPRRYRSGREQSHAPACQPRAIADSQRCDRDGSPQRHGSRSRGRPHGFKSRWKNAGSAARPACVQPAAPGNFIISKSSNGEFRTSIAR